MARIDHYLQLAVSQKASDIHFSSQEPVRLRIHGDLIPLDEPPISHKDLEVLLFEILSEADRKRCIESKNLDKSYSIPNLGNFRLNIFWNRLGLGAVLRTIPSKIPTLAELGMPDIVRQLSDLGKGLVLVTGPTGSGKSTTLAAMINYINESYNYHILTAEDPVEFVHPSKKCLVNQREIGSQCHSFSDALKYALREDPDVILVGEMRDLETIGLALTAAETGHLVFGTLHTRGAPASIDRVIDSFPANQQAMIRTMLSESLAGVISQVLLKTQDGNGRVAAQEIMVVNHAISNLIREGKTFQIPSIIQTARKEGMILMEQHIKELVGKKIVSAEEANQYLEEPLPVMNKGASYASSPVKPPTTAAKVSAPPPPAPKPAVAKPNLSVAPPPAPKAPAPPPVPTAAAVPKPPPAPAPVRPAPPPIAPPAPPQNKAPTGVPDAMLEEAKGAEITWNEADEQAIEEPLEVPQEEVKSAEPEMLSMPPSVNRDTPARVKPVPPPFKRKTG